MKIWVLGSRHRNADNCIDWTEDFPYFSNCDLLIINTCSLDRKYYNNNEPKFINDAKKSLFDMLMINNKNIIVILGGTVNWLPVYPIINIGKFANIKEYDVIGEFKQYLENVKKTNYNIEQFYSNYFFKVAQLSSTETYPFARNIAKYNLLRNNIIKNQGNHIIGASLIHRFLGEKSTLNRSEYYTLYDSGQISFLPPPSEISPEEGIDILLSDILGIETKEIPPEWTNTIILPNLEETESKIYEVMEEIEEKRSEIKRLEEKRLNLIKYRKLLWTKGNPLEKIVEDAFKLLGFNEFRKERSNDLEDGIFDFQTTSEYEHGVLEVKGSDTRTSLAHLTQCNKWVEDYLLEGKRIKGIFVPNQYRLKEYPESQEDREHFEPNEHEYARSREICIIPAYELFNAVIEKMKNNPEVTRENIEEKILSINGLCRLVE